MAEVKWIKIVTDIFDDEKILLIESLPDADSIIVVWFKLLCMAGKQNNSGVFMLNDKIAYTDEMLSTIFRRPINTVRMALGIFQQYGMVEVLDDVITIPNWDKYQTLDAYDKKKERDRLYQQERRDRQKMLIEKKSSDNRLTSRLTVAFPSSDVAISDKEEEEEREKEKDIYKAAKPKLADLYSDYTDELKQAVTDFIAMRKLIKKPMTERALKNMLAKLDRLSTTESEQIAIIEQSITHLWADIYALKGEKQKNNDRYKDIENW